MPAKRIRYSERISRSDRLFPLTPALSLRERENDRQSFREAGMQGIVATLAPVLPPPDGEGWGEGEDENSFDCGCRELNRSLRR